MSTTLPLVSVIIPTTPDRWIFNQRILAIMRSQDYINKEILFDESADKIGKKRNTLCAIAKGDIIIHADSDDLYQPDWVSKSVNILMGNQADVTGMDNINFWSPEKQQAWQYDSKGKTWLSGATMCYWKHVWNEHPFLDKQIGEDTTWIKRMPEKFKIHRHNYIDGFLATIHRNNTCGKVTGNTTYYTKFSTFDLNKLKERWPEEYLR